MILLEEIRGQNKTTLEAVSSLKQEMNKKFEEMGQHLGGRIGAVEVAVRMHSAEITALKDVVAQNSADIRKNSADIQRLTSVTESLAQQMSALTSRVERIEAVLEMKVTGPSTTDLEARIRRIEERLGLV